MEYLVESLEGAFPSEETLQVWLNARGKEGWDLVSSEYRMSHMKTVFTFKRKAQNPTAPKTKR